MELGAIIWVCFVLFFAVVSAVGFFVDTRRIHRETRNSWEEMNIGR